MKVGIFGGTFNPPHKTHVDLAKQAKAQLNLDRLIVMPCGIPPHKRCDVDAERRLEMTKLAFPNDTVCDYELKKNGASYTVETLRWLRGEYPDAELFLIIGGDSFKNFLKWYRPREIAELATLAVADRDRKTSVRTAKRIRNEIGANVVFLDVKPNDVSSTEIRLRYQFGLDNSQFVTSDVDSYVKANGLYSDYADVVQKLRGYLTEQRFMHTFYVVKRGLELSRDDERDKVFLTCLLHDVAKYVEPSNYKKYGFVPPDNMPEPVIHSFLGEYVARQDFGVTDEVILKAIAYHTTGCPNMTRLQKIVYVADKTEQTRPYPLSHLTKGSLDRQLKSCLLEANSYKIAHHGTEEYPLSRATLDYYGVKPTE